MENRRGGFKGSRGPKTGDRDSRSGDNRRGGFRDNSGPREMHKAICADCKNECEVPFKPSEDRPVYCR